MRSVLATRLAQVVRSGQIQDLAFIAQPDVNMAIWTRPAHSAIEAFLTVWAPEAPRLAWDTPSSQLAVQVADTFSVWRALHPAGCDALVADICLLATHFQQETQVPCLSVSLEAGTHARCTRFHADTNRWRLLCTYLAAGTQWVPDGCVDWIPGAHGLTCVVSDTVAAATLAPFDVALLKGRLHPHTQGRGQVHRSPALDPAGPFRVLLRVDESEP